MNAAGREVEAEQLARILSAKGGCVSPPPPTMPTVTNRVDNPRAIYARLAVQLSSVSALPTTSDSLDVSAWFIYDADDRLVGVDYRDGDSAGWTWTGTAHASPSTGPIEV